MSENTSLDICTRKGSSICKLAFSSCRLYSGYCLEILCGMLTEVGEDENLDLFWISKLRRRGLHFYKKKLFERRTHHYHHNVTSSMLQQYTHTSNYALTWCWWWQWRITFWLCFHVRRRIIIICYVMCSIALITSLRISTVHCSLSCLYLCSSQ